MMKSVEWITRVDRLCARLNSGLTAVAVALSILLAVQLTVRAATTFNDAGLLANPGSEMPLVN